MSSVVMSLLAQRFPVGDPTKATPRDAKLAEAISRLLQLHDAGENLELEELEPIVDHPSDEGDDEDHLNEAEEPRGLPSDPDRVECVEFSQGQLVDTTTVKAASEFYRVQSLPNPVYRPLSVVTEKFHFITSHLDLSILRKFAESQESGTPPSPPQHAGVDYVEFSQGCVVDIKSVRAALNFYRIRSTPPLYRPLSIVSERFKFIQNRHDLAILRGFAETEEFPKAPAEEAKGDYIMFSQGRMADLKTVRAALKFYRLQSSPEPVYRPLSIVSERFNFIQNQNDLSTLRKFGETVEEKSCDANPEDALRRKLFERVQTEMNNGCFLHDSDIQGMARVLAQNMGMKFFTASQAWVTKFRQFYDIWQPPLLKPSSDSLRQLPQRALRSLAPKPATPTAK